MPDRRTDPDAAAHRVARFLDMYGTPTAPIEIARVFDPITGRVDSMVDGVALFAADVRALVDAHLTAGLRADVDRPQA